MKRRSLRLIAAGTLVLAMAFSLAACGGSTSSDLTETEAEAEDTDEKENEAADSLKTDAASEMDEASKKGQNVAEEGASEEENNASSGEESEEAPVISGLTFSYTTPLQYAECFTIYNYEDGYKLIDIPESGTYLVIPEDGSVPSDLSEDIIVLQQPLDKIYLAATSAMSLFDAVDAIDHIRLSGTNASGWYVDSAVDAMNAGDMLYAGKYSEPDYEMLVSEGCNLAIESTMIYHTPKVKEMIEDLDIPVLVDRSSYESHPLGRTEWIKLYAALVNKEDEAETFFDEQTKVIEELEDCKNTGANVAFFYVNTDGSVVVRNPEDYIPKMIEIAGGKYIFDDLEAESTSTAPSITMEEFYSTAIDADYLIYNAAIDSPLGSVDELIAKDALFADFKAVKEGNVWTTGKNFYQATDIVGQMIKDVNIMLNDGDPSEMTFLSKVE